MEVVLKTARALVLLSLLALGAGGAVPRPKVTVTKSGGLTLTLPAALLRSREVTQQLTSGLTTVFVLTVNAKDESGTIKGGARIDIRLELWEEKYFVTVTEPTGQERKLAFASEAALAKWWSEQPVLVVPPRKFGARVDAQVRLRMLPFSSQEQKDAQRWLARTLSATDGSTERGPAQSEEILRIIVETSVRRRPLLEHHWTVRAEREEAR